MQHISLHVIITSAWLTITIKNIWNYANVRIKWTLWVFCIHNAIYHKPPHFLWEWSKRSVGLHTRRKLQRLIPLYCTALRVDQIQQISDSTSHHNANTRSFSTHERCCRGEPGPGDMQPDRTGNSRQKKAFCPRPAINLKTVEKPQRD